MPISRPLLVALVAVVVLGAVVLITRGGGEESESLTPTPAFLGDEAAAPEQDSPQAAEGDAAAARGEQSEKPGDDGVQAQVAKALERKKVAVVVLYQPGAADDEATLEAVRGIEQARDGQEGARDRVEIFSDKLTNAGDYLGVTAALGVSQAPAVAIVRPTGEARLLEGFQDRTTLRQHLADAL